MASSCHGLCRTGSLSHMLASRLRWTSGSITSLVPTLKAWSLVEFIIHAEVMSLMLMRLLLLVPPLLFGYGDADPCGGCACGGAKLGWRGGGPGYCPGFGVCRSAACCDCGLCVRPCCSCRSCSRIRWICSQPPQSCASRSESILVDNSSGRSPSPPASLTCPGECWRLAPLSLPFHAHASSVHPCISPLVYASISSSVSRCCRVAPIRSRPISLSRKNARKRPHAMLFLRKSPTAADTRVNASAAPCSPRKHRTNWHLQR